MITPRQQFAQALGMALFVCVLITMFFTPVGSSDNVNLRPVAKRTAPALGGTFIIGDSTTWRLTGEYDNTFNLWSARHPGWYVDGVGGRNVNQLDDRVDAYLRDVDSKPYMFVMALGTNPDPEDDWYKSHFLGSLNKLPDTTKVILVVPIRAGSNKGFKGEQVSKYAQWIHEIAAERTNTIVANWRQRVFSDRTIDLETGIGEWTNDGIHQRNPFGRAEWMDILDRAVARY